MYLIADASGPIGRGITEQLLGHGQLARILTTDVGCRELWRGHGVEVNEGDPRHASSWVKALDGVETLILVSPPYVREDGSMKDAESYHSALLEAFSTLSKQVNVVLLSAMGAERKVGWTNQFGELEAKLKNHCSNLSIIRSAYVMENLALALAMAKHHSVFPSFLSEKRSYPMVARRDLVNLLVSAAQEPVTGFNLMELHGPEPYGVNDLVEAGCNVLTKNIASLSLPQDQWLEIMKDQGLTEQSAALWTGYYLAMNDGEIESDPDATPLAGETLLSDALFQIWKNMLQSEKAAIDPDKKLFKGLE